uniref:Putative secreted protein n=1 Tax=Anopheles triannulatus TaxID=58253 RepID=A0A2M4B5H5_9DIPT
MQTFSFTFLLFCSPFSPSAAGSTRLSFTSAASTSMNDSFVAFRNRKQHTRQQSTERRYSKIAFCFVTIVTGFQENSR